MINNNAISVRDLSKTYTIKRSSNTLRNYIGHLLETNKKREIEVLKDISFDIPQGACVGLIGSNGAGKSTLLKILSKIVWPSKGTVQMNGRLSAMLEVGTGFYPDLTGRENIYLSGSFLGMSKNDIEFHLDDIIDFAGVGSYIDSPVRYYSSGMYVRLGFSVASFLQQEILIIDEILAVGDRTFRERCINSMKDGNLNKGKTCLIVSHNLSMINALCSKTMFLNKGKLDYYGNTATAISQYLDGNLKSAKSTFKNDKIEISGIQINGQTIKKYEAGSGDKFEISLMLNAKKPIKSLLTRIQIRQGNYNVAVLNNTISHDNFTDIEGLVKLVCTMPRLNLNNGNYTLDLDISDGPHNLIHINSLLHIELEKGFFFPSSMLPSQARGACLIDHSWTIHE